MFNANAAGIGDHEVGLKTEATRPSRGGLPYAAPSRASRAARTAEPEPGQMGARADACHLGWSIIACAGDGPAACGHHPWPAGKGGGAGDGRPDHACSPKVWVASG